MRATDVIAHLRRPKVRRAVAIPLLLAAAGCGGSTGERAPEMGRPGPVLVAEVVNQARRQVVFAYEFETADGSSAGGGEGFVPPCSAMVERWSEITGAYVLLVDGEIFLEDRLAPGQGDGAFLVVRIHVGRDGEPELVGSVLRAVAPPPGVRELAGCG